MMASPVLVGTLSVAERGTVYVCQLPNATYVRISKSAYDLFRSVQDGASFEELAEVARRTQPGVVAADIEAAYRDVAAKLTRVEARGAPRRSGFWLTFTLLPARLVALVARPFTHAYHPAIAIPLLIAIAIGGWLAATRGMLTASIEPGSFGIGYLLFLGSLLVHELGHAAACVRYGARPGAIGATMYFVYPALYTDVTAAWTLPRRQRVVVDLGGTYFQLVAAVGLVIAHALTAWPPLSVAVLLTLAACALSLNPILKFDGYWVVADALGVANLGQVPARLGAIAWARLRGRRAVRLPWHWSIVTVLAIYSVATTGFWLYFLSRLIITGSELASTYPALLRAVWQPLQTGSLEGHALFALFNATLVLLFGALVVQRLVRAMVRFVASRIRPPIAGG